MKMHSNNSEGKLMKAQSNVIPPVVSVCSLHPLAAQILRDAIIVAGTREFETRVLTTFQELQPQERGELLFLDGCCDNDWPKPALRWQRNGGRVIVLLSAKAAHPGRQLRALFLGVKGVIVPSGNWQNEVHHAIRV